jgi:hypothetical protein
MGHLWVRDKVGDWAVLPLDGFRVPLSAELGQGEHLPAPESAPASVVQVSAEGRVAWVLLVADTGKVRVNGRSVPTRIRVLRDQDEIRVGAERFFFSAEERAQVCGFSGDGQSASCPRCKQPLHRGDLSVRCPGTRCGVSYHQSEVLPCWTYADRCALCGYPTALDAGYQFSPEDL